MNRRLTTIAILVAVVAAIYATPAIASRRACGREVAQGTTASVTITQGRVPCPEARKVIASWLFSPRSTEGSLFPAHSTEHGGHHAGLSGKSWTMLDGWTCLWGSGFGACFLGGSGPLKDRKPRDAIEYIFPR